MKNKDLKMLKRELEKSVKNRYKSKLSYKIGDIFENMLLSFIVCLAIIFRPINLIIIGIITIIILLI